VVGLVGTAMCFPKTTDLHNCTTEFKYTHLHVSALEVGQLVKDDYFTLFESIGAIEVCTTRL